MKFVHIAFDPTHSLCALLRGLLPSRLTLLLKKTASEKMESTERLLSADAPSLTEKKISQDGWVGTIYSYKSDFKEVFEYLEIHRLSPPEARPEYKTKRDENDTGLEPVNRERLHFRDDNTPYTG